MAMSSTRTRPCAEGIIRSTSLAANRSANTKRWVLLASILASSIANIDESVVNIALPAIETDLQTSAIVVQWIVNAYLLAVSALLLVGGATGDQFGRRRFFIVGISIFAAASLWCGLAPDLTQLILARAVQGAGTAVLLPCSLALIGATFDETECGRAIGTWAAAAAVATAIAPLLGGWIVDHFSWRWIFLINLRRGSCRALGQRGDCPHSQRTAQDNGRRCVGGAETRDESPVRRSSGIEGALWHSAISTRRAAAPATAERQQE